VEATTISIRPPHSLVFTTLLLLAAVLVAWPDPAPLSHQVGRGGDALTIRGQVSGVVRRAVAPDGTGFLWRVHLVDVRLAGQPVAGIARLTVQAEPLVSPGAIVGAVARVRPVRPVANPGSRDPSGTLLARGILLTARASRLRTIQGTEPGWTSRLRRRFRRWSDRALSPPSAGFVQAVVLGDSGAVGREQRQPWQRSGLAHLLAISGLHVDLVALAIYQLAVLLLARLWPHRPARRLAALPATTVAWLYVLFAGAPLSAVRAACVITAVAVTRAAWRPPDMATALCCAALVLVICDPPAATDPACQLSFGAVLALAVAMPPMTERLRSSSALLRAALLPVLAGVVCTLGTLPALAWHFGATPLVGIAANPVAIPLVGFGVVAPGVLTALLLVVGGAVSAWPLEHASGLAQAMAEHVADGAAPIEWTGLTTVPALVLLLGVVAVVCAPRLERPKRLLLTGIALITLAGASLSWSSKPDALRLTFLAVGHGDAVIIQLGGRTVLVDGGGNLHGGRDPGATTVVPALRALGVAHIDLLVISHAHPDHYLGLQAVVDAVEVSEIWVPDMRARAPPWRLLMGSARRAGAHIRVVRPHRRRLGSAVIRVLHPSALNGMSANDASVVFRLDYGEFSALLTGDVEAAGEAALLRRGSVASTVLKVPHHGSRTSSGLALLRAVRPALAVAQASDGGAMPFPHPGVEARYASLGIPLWVTGRHGALQVRASRDGRFSTHSSSTGSGW
jgi:competence protein ComEC